MVVLTHIYTGIFHTVVVLNHIYTGILHTVVVLTHIYTGILHTVVVLNHIYTGILHNVVVLNHIYTGLLHTVVVFQLPEIIDLEILTHFHHEKYYNTPPPCKVLLLQCSDGWKGAMYAEAYVEL